MRKFDPFGLYSQKYDLMPILRDTNMESYHYLEVIVYGNAGWIDRQLYQQLRDKYSAG
tara:strand:- start:517 stop:690 length:174 start_codon:yes stop_codon:yes gene_type:complete